MVNIILCGGSGTRLWPISRTLLPKQFVKLFNKKSLFQLTVERNSKICDSQFIVSNGEQYFLAIDQLEELNEINNKYLLEPIGRNTAPAIALTCFALPKDEIVFVTPSDHLIKNEIEYQKVVKKAIDLAKEDYLVTFGIKPTSPETGFGYIETDSISKSFDIYDGLDVLCFKEKPNFQLASAYLEENIFLEKNNLTNKYHWNSGMFCFKVEVFLEELKKYSPEIYETSLSAYNNANKDELIRIKHNDMLNIPEDSIDYAVMEKSTKVKVVPSDIDWNDVGSFDALYEELAKDKNGNTYNSNHIFIGSKNNLIFGNERKIATIDIEDLIIIDTGDALLISKKGSSQKVKEVVSKIKQLGNGLHDIHLTGHRPWGTYTILEDANGYKIKRIEVKPNSRLSLQSHKFRNEHWVVVSGVATINLEDKVFKLKENESTYIKAGDRHRLANETDEPLIIIEAQVGEYTGEDDIIRYDDDYKRENNA
ncbi:mannose-1-phosphate guanylyltransferase/mannose-6-phosphate isomerase [Halarcobacter ebronensis]|uniref:mannose-1-phosphate guanylyltransferase n=1 Tax=Halarcobacter ebronensis TaxID=1462615 RepID=A0A4Q0YE81_9BACT|nr:mannose-1-phosphate guanylyltransferase/mannose-6-phosphate isomerase [Halarcobacter ebronensis]RXJ67419.1 mannose-1-phosphate guanylyltransferase/mannose-6-phosphate isomerase [Halarcobacter ebronensis]